MGDIPNANDFIGRDDDQGAFLRFADFVTSALTRVINENKLELAAGKSIRFQLPVLRDMGESRRLWIEHFPLFLTHLAQRGWLAERDMEASEIELLISVPKEYLEKVMPKSDTRKWLDEIIDRSLDEFINKADTDNE